MCEGLVSPLGLVANDATVGDAGWAWAEDGESLVYLLAGSRDLGRHCRQPSSPERSRRGRATPMCDGVRRPRPTKRDRSRLLGRQESGDAFPFAPEVLAHAFFPAPAVPEALAGDIHFNDAYTWGVGDPSRYKIFSVACRVRHSLGLGHSSNPAAVMYPIYQGSCRDPRPRTSRDSDVVCTDRAWCAATGMGRYRHWRHHQGEAVERSGIYTVTAAGRDVWGSRMNSGSSRAHSLETERSPHGSIR